MRTTAPLFGFRAPASNGALTRACLRRTLTLLGVAGIGILLLTTPERRASTEAKRLP
ncbi:hypothetical protein OG244_25550 [Streptomyces brevispora]|uniref:hypothetical protein n=1 Tax=Streptomyces brevispora TaxID=887462 RepID=UPI002E30A58D|nr:hypothetical protein [Streptomyces brevispora]